MTVPSHRLPTRALVSALLVVALAAALLAAAGCETKNKRRIRSVCGSDGQCQSGFCYKALCLDPDADEEPDGLINRLERLLGTDPLNADSDGDGLDDREEVGDDVLAPLDSDGDFVSGSNFKHNANESAILDGDGDCIPDQFDPADGVVETDPTEIARRACLSRGVCGAEGATVVAACTDVGDGAQPELTCSYDGVPNYEADTELSCDTRDNDCDGKVDEGLTYKGEPDTEPATLGQACRGVGACAGLTGVVECGGGGATLCSVNKGGSAYAGTGEEIACNNVDDDCDARTDDGTVWEDPVTGETRVYGQPCTGRGVCGLSEGRVECDPATGLGVCSTEPGGQDDASGPEICDNADNDCDGDTDEGQVWISPEGVALEVGEACGTGACAGGKVQCKGGKPTCSSLDAGTDGAELCNDVDDDCDGETDEPDGLAFNCPKVGVCAVIAPASVSCAAGGLIVCSYLGVEGYEHQQEVSCNGLDDDCDGQTDEELVAADGTPLGGACAGQGACSGFTGTVVCDPSPDPLTKPRAVCSADVEQGQPEECDLADNDCDGQTDEGDLGIAAQLQCPTLGVCEALALVPPTCVSGQWVCSAVGAPGYEAEEASCDGQDNDCDGLVDEGVAKAFTGALEPVPAPQPPDRLRWPMAFTGDGVGLLFGGLQQRAGAAGAVAFPLGDAWLYEPSSLAWERAADPPAGLAPRAGHAVAWEPVLGVLVVSGGFTGPPGGAPLDALEASALDDLWAWDPAADAWQEVAQTGPGGGAVPARRWHSLTATGDGGLVLHGGVGADGLAQTLRCDLVASAGELSCAWDAAVPQAAPRWGHAALHDAASGRVLLVGGVAAEGVAFAEASTLGPGAAWAPLAAGTTPPPPRVGPAAAVAGGILFVVGGASPDEALTGGAPLADAWQLALPDGAWAPLDVPASLPPRAGAAAWSPDGQSLALVGGAGPFPVATRSDATLALGAGWQAAARWAGPEPRTGAALVVRPDTGEGWLLGGHRAPGASPLQDAWRLTPDLAGWTEVVPATSPWAAADKTRPDVAGAGAAWDPVAQRVLLYGGRRAEDGAPAADLWALKGPAGAFTVPDVQGTPPPAMARPVLAVAPEGSEAWLAGVTGDPAPGAEGPVAAWRLALATQTWAEAGATGGPAAAVALAGGATEAGLHLVALDAAGALSAWRLDATGWTAVGGPVTPDGAAVTGFGGFAFDAAAGRTLVVALDAQGSARALLVDAADGGVEALGEDAGWPGRDGLAAALHPALGALALEGHAASGRMEGGGVIAPQSCAP